MKPTHASVFRSASAVARLCELQQMFREDFAAEDKPGRVESSWLEEAMEQAVIWCDERAEQAEQWAIATLLDGRNGK